MYKGKQKQMGYTLNEMKSTIGSRNLNLCVVLALLPSSQSNVYKRRSPIACRGKGEVRYNSDKRKNKTK
jgi:hypothetical protein